MYFSIKNRDIQSLGLQYERIKIKKYNKQQDKHIRKTQVYKIIIQYAILGRIHVCTALKTEVAPNEIIYLWIMAVRHLKIVLCYYVVILQVQ